MILNIAPIITTVIPITGAAAPDETFNINLGGTLYTFHIQYNARFDFWVMTVSLNGITLFTSVKLVQGVDDLAKSYNANLGGKLQIQSISNDPADPTLNDMGFDKRLVYVTV